jgi:2Fe-2S ferredoxin
VPEGAELVDVADEVRLPIPFSCRSASCATCLIEVVEGAELLAEPNPDERGLLEILGAPAEQRLACQVRVLPGAGRVVVRPTF